MALLKTISYYFAIYFLSGVVASALTTGAMYDTPDAMKDYTIKTWLIQVFIWPLFAGGYILYLTLTCGCGIGVWYRLLRDRWIKKAG